jgi:hypothetical protein
MNYKTKEEHEKNGNKDNDSLAYTMDIMEVGSKIQSV